MINICIIRGENFKEVREENSCFIDLCIKSPPYTNMDFILNPLPSKPLLLNELNMLHQDETDLSHCWLSLFLLKI